MAKKYFYTLLTIIGLIATSTAFAQTRIQPNDARYSTQSIEGLSIYPNPVVNNSKMYIESTKNAPKEVELYNVVGKKMFQVTLNSKELVLPYSVNAGIYIMKITEENATATRKIIVK
ncbi:T9SS type A sorting domain-containing protein [Myroides pelagicus]|uniref:T9SS type A sorting domain-containing protein n=1 Tax=Myroides pelagicus TaxID=270914 RepID=A0A7K1GQ28_9FLAO|nr:T9SS type A sorting domain-containing protein [Myroides pelagicus]MEC4112663.1 T9SS type A sorting domain-containing protein [Myroides pelagicus]MTH30967.1 T9SS type A sorting domain-containing protein [Myroides pelagicus]